MDRGSLAAQPGPDEGPDKAAVATLNAILRLAEDGESEWTVVRVSVMLGDAMRSMAQRYHTRTLPPEFFRDIALGLAGKAPPANQISQLSVAIVEVFKSAAGPTNSKNRWNGHAELWLRSA